MAERHTSTGTGTVMKEKATPPRSYKWFFLGIFLLAEALLIGLDLYYLYGQNDTVRDFLLDWSIVTAIILTLVLLTYFTLKHILLRYMESERRFRELADLLPEGIFESDLSGFLTYANERALEWFGYDAKEVAAGTLNIV